jgi:hypothetical protein
MKSLNHSFQKALAMIGLACLATLVPDLLPHSSTALQGATEAGNTLSFPDQGKQDADFAPKDWKIWKTATGDLNGDGRPDKAFIIVPKDDDPEKLPQNTKAVRVVLVALKNADGSLKTDCKNFGAIFNGQAAAAFGLNSVQIAIDHSVITLTNAGGGADTQSIVAKFSKPQNWDKMVMIGLKRSTYNHKELKQTDWQQDLQSGLVTSTATTWQDDGHGNKKKGSEKSQTQKFYRMRAGYIMLSPKIDARIDAKEWPGLDLKLNSRDDIIAGKELCKGANDFGVTLGALHDLTCLYIRGGIYGTHLDPGDKLVLFDAQGNEIAPKEVKANFSSTLTVFETRYEIKELNDRRLEQKGWVLPLGIEVQNIDPKTKKPRIILSTSASKKMPGGILICKNPGLPLMAHWNLTLPDE